MFGEGQIGTGGFPTVAGVDLHVSRVHRSESGSDESIGHYVVPQCCPLITLDVVEAGAAVADEVDLVEHAGGLDGMLMITVVADDVVAADISLPTIRIRSFAGISFVIAEWDEYDFCHDTPRIK